MSQNCCVTNCKKKVYREEDLKISFHKFMKNEDLLAAWIRAVRRDVDHHFRISSHTRVCSRHFKDSDFQGTLAGRGTLHPTAVPSIFSWKKDSPKRRKPPKPRYVVSKAGPQVANEELEVNSTILNVDKVADEKLEVNTCNTSLNVDEVCKVLEVVAYIFL
ncbi:THAP domain-containing protein 4-like [Stylophora pistillata]|uniref:THAP domain-containing protein 4-like n=1 Tax=Stylophora pistillata TaxID=50429 RepID=UPI000C04CB24|nr:THAP domain-containing protein 4-like [Stylophora pistillata]